jgi:F420-dependent oxidoreductase-like protein
VTDQPVTWGAFVPQGWKRELAGLGPAEAWETAQHVASTAERVGYDHLWVYDHVETVPVREPTHCFEAYTMLAALSQVTARARLGQMVTCVGYRNVGLLAKQAACLDVFSGGRTILGIGAGWYAEEYTAYGYPFPAARDRLALLEDAAAVIPRLWAEPSVSFDGRAVRFADAHCDPKPLQRPRPPLWIGGGGERVTLRIAARHADATNWQVGLDAFRHKSAVLARHCEEIGRDPATVMRTHAPDCRLFDTEADLRRWLDGPGGGHLWGRVPPHEYVRDNLVGTPERVAEQVQGFLDAGCRAFVLWFRDYPATESLERFTAEVVPALRR